MEPDGRHPGRRPLQRGLRHHNAFGASVRRLCRPYGRRMPQRLRPHHWFAERLLAVLSGQRPVH
ncbi:Rv3235 family protein, partial [Streptomyces sp. NPDC002530]